METQETNSDYENVKNEMSSIEIMRNQNLNKMKNMLENEFEKEDLSDIIMTFKPDNNPLTQKRLKPKKIKNEDAPFVFTGYIPEVRKRSARIAKLAPEFTNLDLDDIEEDEENTKKIKRRKSTNGNYYEYDEDDITSLEKIVSKPRRSMSLKITAIPFKRVDQITDEYINNIAKKGDIKVYDPNGGTCCHQCRQKTKDSKTYCRSGKCVGARGQFCGVCLLNRYGEDAAVALKDPKWSCPPCRNLCNCSICRARQGKRPTGILAPIAQREGYKSVSDFLKYLQSLGNHIEPSVDADDSENYKQRSPASCRLLLEEWFKLENAVIGFDSDGKVVFAKDRSIGMTRSENN